jgi:single-strand DNA-binding protein
MSASLNSVFLIGNVTRDTELRFTPKGTPVSEISIAVNRKWKDGNDQKREEVTFVDVTFWGRTAEIAAEYLKKGAPAFIEGRLALDTWEDRETGQRRQKLKVVCENLQLLGDRPSLETAGSGAARQRDPDLDIQPDDIPFRSTIRHDVARSRLSRRLVL